MIKACVLIVFLLATDICIGQSFDSVRYKVQVKELQSYDTYFTSNGEWRGADGAGSIDLGNGKVLWLFSDTFICQDSTRSRKGAKIIRNSIGIQEGYDLKTASIRYYWNRSQKEPLAFFHRPGDNWLWLGHGAMIKNKLIIFFMNERNTDKGLGFESIGWSAVLISNPNDDPSQWEMNYIDGSDTFGLIAGSAAVLKDEKYLYAYGAVEPSTHEIYLMRWPIEEACSGKLSNPEWWINEQWQERKNRLPVPAPLFIGGTEFSVHYDASLKKYIQIQSFGFGDATLGLRMADRIEGKWTSPYLFHKPSYPGIKKPFMYAAKAHPELKGDGICITYNVNSFDFGELIENQTLYFPKIMQISIEDSKNGK